MNSPTAKELYALALHFFGVSQALDMARHARGELSPSPRVITDDERTRGGALEHWAAELEGRNLPRGLFRPPTERLLWLAMYDYAAAQQVSAETDQRMLLLSAESLRRWAAWEPADGRN